MNDKTDPNVLSPELARVFIAGTLDRIKQTQPDFYPWVMEQIHAADPTYQLNGIWDSIVDVGTKFSDVIGKAASAYGDVLINRENAKTQGIIAQDNAKAQIDQMNAALKMQQQQTQNSFAQQQLALQQQQLFNTGSAFSGSSSISPTVLIVGGVALLGIILLTSRKGA